MRIVILNEQNEIMENWYIGRDDCISSVDVKNALDKDFILAHDENEYNKILTLDNFEF